MENFGTLFGLVWAAFNIDFELFGYTINFLNVFIVTGVMSTLVWAVRRFIWND